MLNPKTLLDTFPSIFILYRPPAVQTGLIVMSGLSRYEIQACRGSGDAREGDGWGNFSTRRQRGYRILNVTTGGTNSNSVQPTSDSTGKADEPEARMKYITLRTVLIIHHALSRPRLPLFNNVPWFL